MIVSEIFIQRRQQFVMEHGGQGVQVNGRWLFPDGASCDLDVLVSSSDDLPPTNPIQLSRRKIAYWTERVKRANAKFQSMRASLNNQAVAAQRSGYPPPGQEQLEELRALQRVVQECQASLQEVEQEAERTMPADLRARRDTQLKNQALATEFISTLSTIQV